MILDILVVDDEADIRDLISDVLVDEGFSVRTAKNSVTAFEALAEKVPSAVILDIWLKDSELDGLGILETIRSKYPAVPVVMISGHGNIETAINSLKMGAYDFIEKPFNPDRLLHTLRCSLEAFKLKSENSKLRVRSSLLNMLAGTSPAVIQLRQAIEKVAPTGSRVFITGPAGAGKQAIARVVHEKSHRKSFPFVYVNASILDHEAIEQEFFGTFDTQDMKAPARKVGIFEQADGGTVFIDDVTSIPMELQGKFVRFLQDRTFQRVGSDERFESDVRVIASTHKDIEKEIAEGRFREDLYYRLNVVPLQAPSLNERREDIPLLCDFFLNQVSHNIKLPKRPLSDDAIAALQAYDWPGNIRQLRNVIEWVLIMSVDEVAGEIQSSVLPKEIFSSTPAVMTSDVNTDIMSMKLREAREVFERQYLMAQINRFGGNISRTASFIGMERSALHRKLKSLDLASDEKLATATGS